MWMVVQSLSTTVLEAVKIGREARVRRDKNVSALANFVSNSLFLQSVWLCMHVVCWGNNRYEEGVRILN
jgi:hypothetical protein